MPSLSSFPVAASRFFPTTLGMIGPAEAGVDVAAGAGAGAGFRFRFGFALRALWALAVLVTTWVTTDVVVEVTLLVVLGVVFALEPHAARLKAAPVPIIATRIFISPHHLPKANAPIRSSACQQRWSVVRNAQRPDADDRQGAHARIASTEPDLGRAVGCLRNCVLLTGGRRKLLDESLA